jgi:hypothetical protein
VAEADSAHEVLNEFHKMGAKGGRIHVAGSGDSPSADEILFQHDTKARHSSAGEWPRYRFNALLRTHRPYSVLLPRLKEAAIS